MKRKNWFWQSISDRDIVVLQSSDDGRKFYSQWQNARREAKMSWWIGALGAVVVTFLICMLCFRSMRFGASVPLALLILIVCTLLFKVAYLWFNRGAFESYYDDAAAVAKKHSKGGTSLSRVVDMFKF